MTLTDPAGQPVASIPTTPRALATDPRFDDGGWRDPQGRDLMEVLQDALGADEASYLWRDACLVRERLPVDQHRVLWKVK